MKTVTPQQEARRKEPPVELPIESDWDWEYTGVVYTCPDCGLEFEEFPPDLDVCPACGADIWQTEES